ncbi:hypothetical protein NHQ30_005086 [Ciborinia camelliae]|nr:hypothetical protein NHQ30_005086 [Ciborinia camelliae]
MATLYSLKRALKEKAAETSSQRQPLSDIQYIEGFDTLMHGSEWKSYEDFIIPQLSKLLSPLFNSRTNISVLEIGPGSQSVLGHLPIYLRQKFRRYAAFEPNILSAKRLEEWFCDSPKSKSPLPCLQSPPEIYRAPFDLKNNPSEDSKTNIIDGEEQFDVILFCHSLYGMKPKHLFIRRALDLLVQGPESGIVIVFHRDEDLDLDGLTSDHTAIFPTGTVSVVNEDGILNAFAPFIAGFVMKDIELDMAVRGEWIKICRALTCHNETLPSRLLFRAPQRMLSFTRGAIALPELAAEVPLASRGKTVKSWEARLHQTASIISPTNIEHVQKCIQWALKYKVGLTVLGGGHSGHCLWPHVVSVDMNAFNQVHIIRSSKDAGKADSCSDSPSCIVAEAGCKTEDIVRKGMESGLTVPLGSRPSVGAGLWLQGGIGHLSRLHGLACDSIIGAVIVSVESGQVVYVGHVPNEHLPAGAVRSESESHLLWAIQGAGSNFGIVISVTFRAYPAPTYSVRNWVLPLKDITEARLWLSDFDKSIAKELPRHCSVDAYLYWHTDQLHLGVTMIESSTTKPTLQARTCVSKILGPENEFRIVDGVELFDTEMYMSGMHGGHGGGKTSSFKRCLFLKNIGEVHIVDILVAAIQTRPFPFCYLHLLQGGGAVDDIASEATAFGCRDWDFACIITAVWPRDQNGTEAAQTAVQWVYNIVRDLLPFCSGVYSADLGPDPRDIALAVKAFGPNLPRLVRLKHKLDPYNVLAYTCPLPEISMKQKLIILVTGDNGAGKDYCADIWVSEITKCTNRSVRSVSISDATKREYAIDVGADFNRLLSDRAYKEQHRPALTAFFQGQVHKRPQLPMKHFLNVIHNAADIDVLLITGMRDEAPVPTFSHSIPDCRLLEVRVKASQSVRGIRKGCHSSYDHDETKDRNNGGLKVTGSKHRPNLIFDNDTIGNELAETFAKQYLLPFLHEDLERLYNMVRAVPDFPSPGIQFRHVLDISQQRGGLLLCTSLLQTHFNGDWTKFDALACCEAGGFVFASSLGMRVDVPLALIRESGKLPQPTISIMKSPSHISSTKAADLKEKRFEMNQNLVREGSSVVIVDDVLATGRTLCAMIKLLVEAGVRVENVSIMVVAEFPIHRGREFLLHRGFGGVNIQSLLVFDGA